MVLWGVEAGGPRFTKVSYLEDLRNFSSTQRRIETIKVKVFNRMAIVSGTYEERGFKTGQPYHRHW
jgi:hypothetical protein